MFTERKDAIPESKINEQEALAHLPATLRIGLRHYNELKERLSESLLKKSTSEEKAKLQQKNAKLLEEYKIIKEKLRGECRKIGTQGDVFLRQERLDDALTCYHAILVVYKQLFGVESYQYASTLGNIGNIYYQRGDFAAAMPCAQSILLAAEKKHGENSETVATALNNIGNILSGQGKFLEARMHYEKSYKIVETLHGKNSIQTTLTLNNLANLLPKLDEYELSLKLYRQILDIQTRVLGADTADVAMTLNGIGTVLRDQSQFSEALEYHQRALVIYEKLSHPSHRLLAATYNHIGLIFSKQGKYKKAISFYEKSLAIIKEAPEQNNPLVAEIFAHLGNVYFEKSDLPKSLSYTKKSLQMREEIFGKDSNEVAEVNLNIANIYAKQEKHEEAIKLYEQAIAIKIKLFGENNSNLIVFYFNIGNAFLLSHQHVKALTYFNKGLEIAKKNSDKDNYFVGEGFTCLGNYYAKLGQYPEALKNLHAGLAVYEKIYVGNNAPVSSTLNNIGLVLREEGQYAEAIKYFQRAIKMEEYLFGKDNEHVATSLTNMGHVFSDQRKSQEALSCYERAIAITNKVYGENSSQVATIWNDIGNVLCDHGLLDIAISYYQNALTILDKIDGGKSVRFAVLAGSLGLALVQQGNYEKAEQYREKSLAVFRELLGEESEEIAVAYNNDAGVYVRQNQYEKALKNYFLAYEIRKKNLGVQNHKACEIQGRIIRTYIKFAETLDAKPAHEQYQKAAEIGEFVLNINETILAGKSKELSDYDVTGHNELLALLAKVYLRQGKITKVGELYYSQAKRFSHSPLLVLYYSKRAINYLSLFPTHQRQVIELYGLCATIGHQHQRYHFALANLRKALELDAKSEIHQKQLKEWQTERAHQLTYLDEDLAAQMEHCRDTYDEIQLLIFAELEAGDLFLEHVKNRCTELIININSLLDMAYGRFVRETIYHDNHEEIDRDLYFPLATSQQALQYEFKRNQITFDPHEIKEDIFKDLKHPQGVSIKKTLIAHGYLDKNGNVHEKFLKDAQLKELDARFDCLRVEIIELFKKAGVSKRLSTKSLKELNAKIQTRLEYRPPETEKIIAALQKAGILTELKSSATLPKTYRVSSEFKLPQGILAKAFSQDPIEQKRIINYEQQIIDKLYQTIKTRGGYSSLDRTFPAVYALIEREQPFHYCAEAINKETPRMWQQSWVDKIITISNGGKHIGLTPQALSDNLAERMGTLKINKLRVMVCYVEPVFYPWTLASAISSVAEMPDAELMKASNEILKLLKDKDYIQQGVVSHPLAKKYIDEAKIPNNFEKRDELETAFCKKLHEDLPKKFKLYAKPISLLMLRRVLQLSHTELHFDNYVELHDLMKKSLHATHEIISTFGKARHAIKKKLSYEESKLYFNVSDAKKDFSVQEKKGDDFTQLVAHPENAKPSDWIKYHRWVINIAKAYHEKGDINKVVAHYEQAAKTASLAHPILAIHYYRKAARYYRLDNKQEESLKQTCLTVSAYYIKNGLWHSAIRYLSQHSKNLSSTHKKALREKCVEYQEKFKQTFLNYPPDIYSQVEYAKQKFLHLQYLLLKSATDLENEQLKKKIQYMISEIVIKLRHLLDQIFMRLVHQKIYLPNNKLAAINIKNTIKFYSFYSKKELMAELKKKEIISDEKEKVSLDRDFPKVFDLLMQAQSFTDETWLTELIELSNQLKHVGFKCLTAEELKIEHLLKTVLVETDKIAAAIFKVEAKPLVESKNDSQNPHRLFPPAELHAAHVTEASVVVQEVKSYRGKS